MSKARLRGITWGHRRAIDPLKNSLSLFYSSHPEVEIHWSSRPLHSFEFTPIVDLAKDYDLIVFDHPFVGEIAADYSLQPLDELIPPESLTSFVGPSLESYRYADQLWAVPIDAACQVAVSRPDLMTKLGRPPPENWSELIAFGHNAAKYRLSLAIGLHGVHSLMTFFSLCANLGSPCAVEAHKLFVERDVAVHAIALLGELLEFCPKHCLDWSSIELHQAMTQRDDLVFCPAVYCYATYAEADHRRPLRFHNFPGPLGCRGSTIGGAGLGISAECRSMEAAIAYAEFASSLPAQMDFARNHGQPALTCVWKDDEINARFDGCFRATHNTIDESWIRPRYNGYLAFQAKAGNLIEKHLRGLSPANTLIDQLVELHQAKLSEA
jgi:multiple sugar transport system substrate-binding protein